MKERKEQSENYCGHKKEIEKAGKKERKSHLILDISGSIGILQCIQSLHEIPITRTDTCYHEGPTVSTQRILNHGSV